PHLRGGLHQALHVARFDRAVVLGRRIQGRQDDGVDAFAGVFPLRAELAKTLKMPAAALRCVHAEGSGCYGHNGADDVAVDAALLAGALPGRRVRLKWMRDDEFGWDPYGPAMVMRAKAALGGDGKIADWDYEVWSNTHSTRPQSTDGTNVLAAWYLAEP